MENKLNSASDDEIFCFNIFHRVSRSFATVTEMLDEPLRTAVCIFYLILRGLDTIEDYTTLEESMKATALKAFPKFLNKLSDRPEVCDYRLKSDCNESYVELMDNFDKVLSVFNRRTSDDAKNIIRYVADEMASGMIKYAAQPIDTLNEYNEYCYYVAGLVGMGLTELFQLYFGLQMEQIPHSRLKHLSITTGSFLQKVNILRDIYEDLNQPAGRSFYPKEVWTNYVNSAQDLIDPNCREQAVACLNHLINDAFQHLPESIEYMSLVTKPSIFRFTAIPQCMAVATLEAMFNNPAVFGSSVKIAREDRDYIFENVIDMNSCLSVMESFLNKLSTRSDFVRASCTKNWIVESVQYVCKHKIK